MIEPTSIDGVAVGPDQVYWVVVKSSADYGLNAQSQWHQRAGIGSTFQGQTPSPRMLSLCVYPGAAATGNLADWVAGGLALLRPHGALREIVGTYLGETVSTHVAIDTPALPSDRLAQIEAAAIAPSQFYRKTTTTTSTSSPLTNNGNAPAAPKITIKPTTGTVVRRRVTLVDVSNRGLINHPLRIAVNTNSASVTGGDNIYLFDRGKAEKFQAIAPPGSATPIFFLCNLLPNESRTIDVVYGGAVDNQITANKLEPSGFDWAHASFTNTLWIYRNTATTLNGIPAPSIWEFGRALRRPGSWTFTEFGGKSAASVWTEDLVNNTVNLAGNAAITMLSQIAMANSSSIAHFDTNVTWADSMAKQRRAGEATYRDSESSSTESDIDLTDAIQVILWSSTLLSALFDIDSSGSPIQVALQSGEVPTIVVDSSATTMARINGTLTNTTTGDSIEFNDVFIDADASGGLVIDTNAAPGEKMRVYPSLDTSPLYSPHDAGWRFSNPAGFPLVPGDNAWTWTGDGAPTITFEFADTWV